MTYIPPFNKPCEKRCDECQWAYFCKQCTVEEPNRIETTKEQEVVFIPKEDFHWKDTTDGFEDKSSIEIPKEIEMSFDCEMSKEAAEFFKKQAEELEAKEKEILGIYRYVARSNARYYLPILKSLASDEAKEELLEDIILKTLCKGWNDCFEINVKHNKEVKL